MPDSKTVISFYLKKYSFSGNENDNMSSYFALEKFYDSNFFLVLLFLMKM